MVFRINLNFEDNEPEFMEACHTYQVTWPSTDNPRKGKRKEGEKEIHAALSPPSTSACVLAPHRRQADRQADRHTYRRHTTFPSVRYKVSIVKRLSCLSTFVKTLRMVVRLLINIIGLRACAPSRASLGALHHAPSTPPVAPAPAPVPPASAAPAAAAAAAALLEAASLLATEAADTMSNKWAIASTVKVKCHFLSLKRECEREHGPPKESKWIS